MATASNAKLDRRFRFGTIQLYAQTSCRLSSQVGCALFYDCLFDTVKRVGNDHVKRIATFQSCVGRAAAIHVLIPRSLTDEEGFCFVFAKNKSEKKNYNEYKNEMRIYDPIWWSSKILKSDLIAVVQDSGAFPGMLLAFLQQTANVFVTRGINCEERIFQQHDIVFSRGC